MRMCILDGNLITDKKSLHDTLSASLLLPDWYGRNLDALYDCLTDIQEETEIQILNPESLESHLGSYSLSLARTIYNASQENTRINYSYSS